MTFTECVSHINVLYLMKDHCLLLLLGRMRKIVMFENEVTNISVWMCNDT